MINRTPARTAGRTGVAERPVVPLNPGNAGGGKGAQSRPTQDVVRDREIGQPSNSEKCSESCDGVTRESEGGGRLSFYALYDKISRDDILAHAYAQCRSNKGAPGIDGQDFADIEAYGRSSDGCRNWRLPSAGDLPAGSHQRVFIPKANANSDPLGISSVRDRVSMTARCWCWCDLRRRSAAGNLRLPRGRNAQKHRRGGGGAVPGSPGVVDADLADYFGSISHADLLSRWARRIVDRRVLHLIKRCGWNAPWKNRQRGRTHARRRLGIAGAASRRLPRSHHCWPILYYAPVCAGVKKLGLEQSLGTRSSLIGRSRDLCEGQREKALHICARSWQAEADSE